MMRKEDNINETVQLNCKILNSHIGVLIEDFDDITQVTAETAAYLKRLVNIHHVVVIRGKRKWKEEEQQKFTEQLGKIELPVVYSIPPSQVNEHENSGKVKKGSGVFWHSDNSYQERPSYLSVFQMFDIPKSGTKTSFASLINLYQNLSEDDKRIWRDYSVLYRDKILHPLLWKHPFNGKETVYFDIGFSTDIINHCENGGTIPMKESNEIFNYINDKLSSEASLLEHDWQEGDIIILDNYAVAHRASVLFENENRTLLRMTTEGVYF